MRRLAKRLAVLAATTCFVVTGAFCAQAEEAHTGEMTEQFQQATDAICALTEDSTPEEMEAAFQLLEDISTEGGEQSEAALTGSIVDAANTRGSIQLIFAQLQQQQAELGKQQAQQQIDAIQAEYEESANASNYLNVARVNTNEAASKGTCKMAEDMRVFLQERNLFPSSINPNAGSYTKAEWETITQLLEVYVEQLGAQTQTQMVYLQDYISQYNSYLQGSAQQAQSVSEMLAGLANSQTMLGGGSAGMTVTCLLGGAVLGSLVTLLVLRKRKTA